VDADCCCLLLCVGVDPCSLPTVAFWSFNNINAATQDPLFEIPPSLGPAGAQAAVQAVSDQGPVLGFDNSTFDPADTTPGINQSWVISNGEPVVSPTPFGTVAGFFLRGQYLTGVCCRLRYLCELVLRPGCWALLVPRLSKGSYALAAALRGGRR
jgi:hypothetical protein